jgi:hypothetical protein
MKVRIDLCTCGESALAIKTALNLVSEDINVVGGARIGKPREEQLCVFDCEFRRC